MKKFCILLLLIYSACLLISCASSEPDKSSSPSNTYAETRIIQFKGKEIFDSRAGMLISPNNIAGIISINSDPHKYHLIVPYSNSLEIKTGPDIPLYAIDHANGDVFSIMKPVHPKTTSEEYLQTLLKNIKKRNENLIIHDAGLVEPQGQKILRYRASYKGAAEKFKNRNTWSWNYWVAALKGSEWYVVHWSKTDRVLGKDASNVSHIYKVLTFFADNVKEFK